MGLLYCREKREAYRKGKKRLNNYNCNEGRIIKNLREKNIGKRSRAEADLHQFIREFCREHGFAAEDFAPAHLDDALREKIDRIEINLHVYAAEAGCTMIFNHPYRYDSSRPTVSLYLARDEDEEKRRKKAAKKRRKRKKGETDSGAGNSEGDEQTDGPELLLFHCGLIKQEKKFLSHMQQIPCHFCRRNFSVDYFKMHLCTARETCKKCRQIKLEEDDYVDIEIAQLRCVPPTAITRVDLECDYCTQVCNTVECKNNHQALCKNLGYCEQCRKVYRHKKSGKPHKCGDDFCRTCFQPFNKLSFRQHRCKLEPTRLQKHHSKVAPFDLETIIDPKTGRHKVNAAGLIRESPRKSGSFDQIAFFNRNLRHEKNGVLEEGVFSYKYWPDHMDDQIDKIRRKAPKKIKSLLRPRAAPKKRKAAPADEKEDEKAKRQKLVLQFLDREAGAAEGDDDSSDEEMNSDNEEDIVMQHEREAGAREPDQGIDDEDEEEDFENSALSQFLDFVLTPEHFGYVFLSHNGAKFDSILVLNALHKKNVHVDPLFDGNKILQMRIPALKITFIDTMKYLKIPLSGKIYFSKCIYTAN